MLDLDFIRKNPQIVKNAVSLKNDNADIDGILRLDIERREIISKSDELRSERKVQSDKIAVLKKSGGVATDIVEIMKIVGSEIHNLDSELEKIDAGLNQKMQCVPNIPQADVPIGNSSENNEEIRHWGVRAGFDFTPKPHWEIGENLGILDLERARKISGGGFGLYVGLGARLERALYSFMLDIHTKEHGYTEIMPPYLVLPKCLYGCGQFPKFEEQVYKSDKDDLFLITTAEVPVTNFHRDEILLEDDLPKKYVAYTACFRREAGSYGKDTRGIVRVHQFDKVELVKFVKPENSNAELESLVLDAEAVLQKLNIPYRVMKLCTGDLSFAAAKCYDIEIWAPGMQKWLEVSSCSNFESFQARRANMKFKPKSGGKPEYVHTLNGSGTALARLFVSILETYQQKDGSVCIPEALKPYMGNLNTIQK